MTITAPAISDTSRTDDLTGDWTRGTHIDATAMRNTMGAFPSGVTIITTTAGSRPVGLTISSFASVSMDPPLLLVCVARTANSLPAFRTGGPMAVNVLANDQAWLAKRFAGRSENRFADVGYETGPNNVPLLADTAAWISCHVDRIYDAGDHVILLARANELHRSERQPLLYHSGTMHDWAVAAAENKP